MNRTQRSYRPRTAAAALLALGLALGACADEPALADGAALPDVLDLETAQQWAVDNSPSLRAVAERVAQAHELVKQARSLYFPQIDASYSASYTWLAEGTAGPADDALAQVEEFAEYVARQLSPMRSNLPPAQRYRGRHAVQDVEEAIRDLRDVLDGGLEQYALGVTAGFLLFDGFARECQCAMAKFGQKEAEAGRREARRLLLAGVARGFHGVQLARENIATARADATFNERLLEEAKARRRLGKVATSDVLNFEVALRAARTGLLLAQGEYEGARLALAALMGLPDAMLPERVLISELPPETPNDLEGVCAETLVQYALEHRPGLAQKTLAVQRAKAGVKERRADYYPQVALLGQYSATRLADQRFGHDDFSTTVGVNVSYNLFSGGRRQSRLVQAKHAYRQTQHERSDEQLRVISEVRQALLKLRISQDQLVLQRDTKSFVEKNRDLVEKGYQAGKEMLVRLNQAQRDLVAAQTRLALARVSLMQAWEDLRAATGETLATFGSDE